MGISALASASESTCEYNYSLLHSINHLQSWKLVLYIFAKHVIFNKVKTYRLEACDFVTRCFAKISGRKFLDNLKRATAQDPYRKSSVMESFLMNSWDELQTCNFNEKKPPPRMLTCEYIRTFRASAERSCMSSAFLIKFRVVYYRAAALLKCWSTIDFFLKKILLLLFFLNRELSVHFPKRICGAFSLQQSCNLKTVAL